MISELKREHDEGGFASIVVALTLIIVLALITVGFAQLARREQQNALSKQLATQAYDAAETGINDANQLIATNPGALTGLPVGKCVPPTTLTNAGYSSSIDSANGVSYTCLIINNTPSSLYYTGVQAGTTQTVDFTTADAAGNPAPLGSITVEWDSSDHNATIPAANVGKFPSLATWNNPAVLQISLTSLGTGATDRDTLASNTFTTYLYPVSSGGSPSVNYATAATSQGQAVPAICVNSGAGSVCKATIQGLPNPTPTNGYLLHFLNLYDVSTITITGSTPTPPPPTAVNFVGGQILIDSTGQAQDVLKRLQVRVAVKASGNLPNYPVEGGQGICKRQQTQPAFTDYISTNSGSTIVNPPIVDPCDLSQ